MRLIYKVLLFFYIIGIIIISLSCILTPESRVIEVVGNHYKYVMFVSLIYLLVSIILLILKASGKEPEFVFLTTEHGEVTISVVTLESLARSVIDELKEIKEAKVKARIVKNEVVYYINIVVAKDAIIPELSGKLQKRIVESVEKNSGIKVTAVKVNVANVATFLRHKLE